MNLFFLSSRFPSSHASGWHFARAVTMPCMYQEKQKQNRCQGEENQIGYSQRSWYACFGEFWTKAFPCQCGCAMKLFQCLTLKHFMTIDPFVELRKPARSFHIITPQPPKLAVEEESPWGRIVVRHSQPPILVLQIHLPLLSCHHHHQTQGRLCSSSHAFPSTDRVCLHFLWFDHFRATAFIQTRRPEG